MTEFIISAETFLRLSTIALQETEKHWKYDAELRSVRIEQDGGVAIAIATCGKLLAGECLKSHPDMADGEINVTIHPSLIKIAQAEQAVNGSIFIRQSPGWSIARGQITNTMLPMNAEIYGEYPKWRDLMPKIQASKNNGAFAFSGSQIARMGEASPSGSFVLPQFADINTPVVVRDTIDPNWFGMFLITTDKQSHPAAQLPTWVAL